jgi:hypothetical protein
MYGTSTSRATQGQSRTLSRLGRGSAAVLCSVSLVASAAASECPKGSDPFRQAVCQAAKEEGVSIEVLNVNPQRSACVARSVELPPLVNSGRIAVKFRGVGCAGWAWVDVRVMVQAPKLVRSVRIGEPLHDAVTLVPRERRAGYEVLSQLPMNAVARRNLGAGSWVQPSDISVGLPPGETVWVTAAVGGLVLERSGRIVSCLSKNVCAVLPNGQRVEGRLEGDRLYVEAR